MSSLSDEPQPSTSKGAYGLCHLPAELRLKVLQNLTPRELIDVRAASKSLTALIAGNQKFLRRRKIERISVTRNRGVTTGCGYTISVKCTEEGIKNKKYQLCTRKRKCSNSYTEAAKRLHLGEETAAVDWLLPLLATDINRNNIETRNSDRWIWPREVLERLERITERADIEEFVIEDLKPTDRTMTDLMDLLERKHCSISKLTLRYCSLKHVTGSLFADMILKINPSRICLATLRYCREEHFQSSLTDFLCSRTEVHLEDLIVQHCNPVVLSIDDASLKRIAEGKCRRFSAAQSHRASLSAVAQFFKDLVSQRYDMDYCCLLVEDSATDFLQLFGHTANAQTAKETIVELHPSLRVKVHRDYSNCFFVMYKRLRSFL